MSLADLPWLKDLCFRRYKWNKEHITTEMWFRNTVMTTPALFLPERTQNAFCISLLSILPWCPGEMECNIVFICADDGCMWEALKLLRSSIEWAKARRATHWKISSDTAYDLAPLGARLGAEERSPRWVLRF